MLLNILIVPALALSAFGTPILKRSARVKEALREQTAVASVEKGSAAEPENHGNWYADKRAEDETDSSGIWIVEKRAEDEPDPSRTWLIENREAAAAEDKQSKRANYTLSQP